MDTEQDQLSGVSAGVRRKRQVLLTGQRSIKKQLARGLHQLFSETVDHIVHSWTFRPEPRVQDVVEMKAQLSGFWASWRLSVGEHVHKAGVLKANFQKLDRSKARVQRIESYFSAAFAASEGYL